jgi:hypothetical protein
MINQNGDLRSTPVHGMAAMDRAIPAGDFTPDFHTP